MRKKPLSTQALSRTGVRFLIDAILVPASIYVASEWRFEQGMVALKFAAYLPSVLCAAPMLPILSYIGGLYSLRSSMRDRWTNFRWCFASLIVTIAIMLMAGSLNFDARIGRGVLLVAGLVLIAAYLAHHGVFWARARPPAVICVATTPEDVRAAQVLHQSALWFKVRGLVLAGTALDHPCDQVPVLGRLSDPADKPELPDDIQLILIQEISSCDRVMLSTLRRWRASGVEIASLTDAVETVLQAVPVSLVDELNLFRALGQADMFYIRKSKRLLDIILSVVFLVLLSPFLLLGMLLVRISSPGGVFYRQTRLGKFGKPFEIIKLRTMRLDAEANGPQWSTQGHDPRVIRFGRFLRKYRIDEIPQLFNVLRGEMSFVGPRPERPELAASLQQEIPFFIERLLLQPGLTGWAQVRYPYGESVYDAKRKLEYDLYYLKHMSIMFDLLIILDTVRTVLVGGNKTTEATSLVSKMWDGLETGTTRTASRAADASV